MSPSSNRPALPQRLPASLTYNDLNGDEAVDILCDWFRQLLKGHYLMQPHLTLPMAVLDLRVQVGVDMYIGGSVPVSSPPEHLDISGGVKLTNEIPVAARDTFQTDRQVGLKHTKQCTHAGVVSGDECPWCAAQVRHTEHDFATTVNAAPVPGGLPPDQVREQHGLPVPRPGYGSRDTGSHLFLADIPDVDAALQDETRRVFTAQPAPAAPDTTGGRRGEVADGYVFSPEVVNDAPQQQRIAVDNGSIEVRMDGQAVQHAGISVSAGTHVSSKKELGDQKGHAYESVNGVMDAGPRGLMRPGRGAGGLYTDGRPRLNFGNSQRGS